MAIENRTLIDLIEIADAYHIGIRFAIQQVDGGTVIDSRWHRAILYPGQDLDALLADIDQDITTRPELMASPIDKVYRMDELRSVVAATHTPEVIAEYEQRAADRAGTDSP